MTWCTYVELGAACGVLLGSACVQALDCVVPCRVCVPGRQDGVAAVHAYLSPCLAAVQDPAAAAAAGSVWPLLESCFSSLQRLCKPLVRRSQRAARRRSVRGSEAAGEAALVACAAVLRGTAALCTHCQTVLVAGAPPAALAHPKVQAPVAALASLCGFVWGACADASTGPAAGAVLPAGEVAAGVQSLLATLATLLAAPALDASVAASVAVLARAYVHGFVAAVVTKAKVGDAGLAQLAPGVRVLWGALASVAPVTCPGAPVLQGALCDLGSVLVQELGPACGRWQGEPRRGSGGVVLPARCTAPRLAPR
jgi:hypothetical protein